MRLLATVGAFRAVPQRDLEPTDARTRAGRDREIEHLRKLGPDRDPSLWRRAFPDHARDPHGARSRPAGCRPGPLARRSPALLRGLRPATRDHPRRALSPARTARAAQAIRERGGHVRRVVLDYELKRDYQRFLQERNRQKRDSDGRPDRTADEVREWALGAPAAVRGRARPVSRCPHRIRGPGWSPGDRRPRDRHSSLSRRSCCRQGPFGLPTIPIWRWSGGWPQRSRTRPAVRSARGGGHPVVTDAERIDAVAKLGFTPRQAGFLVTVALHAGVCLSRQYATYSGLCLGAGCPRLLRHAGETALRDGLPVRP